MKTQYFQVADRTATVRTLETAQDLSSFQDWARRNFHYIAYDTETTGLNIYQDDFRLRTVQFGNAHEGWVLPVELSDHLKWVAAQTLNHAKVVVAKNAAFDNLIAERFLGVNLEALFNKTVDVEILSRLVDSRAFKEGGTGHSLEELVAAYVDKQVAEEVKGSATKEAKRLGLSKGDYFASVPIFDDAYNLYAGADTILTALVHQKVDRLVPSSARKLISYEHTVSRICSEVTRNGFLLDVDYTQAEAQKLREIEEHFVLQAEGEVLESSFYDDEEFFDLDEIVWGSTQQMAQVFLDRGIEEFTWTDKGQLQLDEKFLHKLADEGDRLAQAIQEARKASKWRKTWFESFLENADSRGYCHAWINTMQARTARQSITGIPAQTLPSGASFVRDCFLAEPGHVMCSIDYSNQELRVAAALSGDRTMIDAFKEGKDLHQMTADAAGVERKLGKMANFLTAYGGGPPALEAQAGVSLDVAKKVIKALNDTYPGLKEMSDRLQTEARKKGYITTGTGRRLYVDKQRPYSAMNYEIQSTSRDITCSASVRLDKKGFTPYLKLLIHDEALFSFPKENAEEMAREAGQTMTHVIKGLEVPTDPKIGGRSWGSIPK